MVTLRELIAERGAIVDLRASNKTEALTEMVDPLTAAGAITNRDTFLADVLDREGRHSTGIGDGWAMPHGRSTAVNTACMVLARAPHGIDWGTFDGVPVKIILLEACPLEECEAHLDRIRQVCQLGMIPAAMERVLKGTTDDIKELLDQADAMG